MSWGLGRRALYRALWVVSSISCLAPTPGDIGGCGQSPIELEGPTFFSEKARIDCERCKECGFMSQLCSRACSNSPDLEREFPVGCVPLVHDGEVCWHALEGASCEDYASFVIDLGTQTPSECNFCPPREPG